MAFNRLSSWFLSESGRNFSGCVIGGAGIGAFCLQFVPHTLLLDKYKDIVHLYRNGITVAVPQTLIDRFNKALELAEIPKEEIRLYKPFSVYGFDIFHAGSSFSRFGCIIGLPVNFSYHDVDTIDKQSIKIKGESVIWGTDEAKEFLNSLVLSEKAQLYAIAREISMTQTPKLLLDSAYGTISIITAYAVSRFLNNRLSLYTKSLNLRLIQYTLVGTFALTNYFFVKDFTQLYYEKQVDESLKNKNPVLVAGAKEFYEKIINRNKALRKLMGTDGQSVYTVLGNENYSFRQRHLPLIQRKAFFDKLLEEKA